MTAPGREPDPAFLERYGPWVLIAGASEGTGAAFARHAAAKGANCILVARRVDKLEELATELRAAYGVEVATTSLDLSAPGARVFMGRAPGVWGIRAAPGRGVG